MPSFKTPMIAHVSQINTFVDGGGKWKRSCVWLDGDERWVSWPFLWAGQGRGPGWNMLGA